VDASRYAIDLPMRSTSNDTATIRRLVAYLLQSFETTPDGPLPPPVRFAEYLLPYPAVTSGTR
jgi:hypothetical protein